MSISRLWCRIFGHKWVGTSGSGYEVCVRDACRGRLDACRVTR